MRNALLMVSFFVTAFVANRASAEQPESARLAGAIAQFVDDQTLIVAHVDLRAVDAQASVAKLIDALQLPKDAAAELQGTATTLSQRIDLLKQHGAQEVFALVNIADFPRSPVMLVIPVPKDTNSAKVVEALSLSTFLGGEFESTWIDGNLVIAGAATIKRVRASKNPAPRPEIAEAFQAVAPSAAQVLWIPSAQTRRVVEEMLPTLPDIAGGVPMKPFASGLRWGAVGVTIPPKPISFQVIAQSIDAQTATTLKEEIAKVVTALGKQPMVRSMIPRFDELDKFLAPTVQGDRLTLDWNEHNEGLKAIVAILAPPAIEIRAAASASRSINNLKQFGLAMHNYHSVNKTFPPRAILSKDGKPLLSWRVAILPFLEDNNGGKLYKEFHLDEPWDSEHNRLLIDRMPEVLRSPHSSAAVGRTTFLAPVMPGAIFCGLTAMPIKQITDGTSNTIMLVEADDDHAVVWTKPEDIEIDLENPAKGLLVGPRKALFALFADGSVSRFPTPEERDPTRLKALITASGGEPVPR